LAERAAMLVCQTSTGPRTPEGTAGLGQGRLEVSLPTFHGPLELLLHLIEKRQLDITTVSLVQVTEQYLDHLRREGTIDVEALSDFVAIGAKLLLIKSVHLLPRPPVLSDAEEEDPAEELSRLLREYRRFRTVAARLQELDELGLRCYLRLVPAKTGRLAPLERMHPSALEAALRRMIAARIVEPSAFVESDPVTVAAKIAELEAELAARQELSFNDHVRRCPTRRAVAAAFLALLHLVRTGKASARQERLFGEIILLRTSHGGEGLQEMGTESAERAGLG